MILRRRAGVLCAVSLIGLGCAAPAPRTDGEPAADVPSAAATAVNTGFASIDDELKALATARTADVHAFLGARLGFTSADFEGDSECGAGRFRADGAVVGTRQRAVNLDGDADEESFVEVDVEASSASGPKLTLKYLAVIDRSGDAVRAIGHHREGGDRTSKMWVEAYPVHAGGFADLVIIEELGPCANGSGSKDGRETIVLSADRGKLEILMTARQEAGAAAVTFAGDGFPRQADVGGRRWSFDPGAFKYQPK